jgi:predicted XRE-type DNA-binding protein
MKGPVRLDDRHPRRRRWLELTQVEAAKRLGVTQPRMNDLLRGRIDKFSLDALMILATTAGLTVEWRVIKPAA